MKNQSDNILSPVLYLPHDGGPLPLLGDSNHENLVIFLREVVSRLGKPTAILVISAHWEEDQPTITSGNRPELFMYYYGFPAEAYKIRYSAPGHPQLAKGVLELLEADGIKAKLDEHRGFDHGLYVPLKLMFPEARIPCIQLSLRHNLDPRKHIAIGKAIAPLRKSNVLIIGSGMSFHNLKVFFSQELDASNESDMFDDWLIETFSSQVISPEQRELRLIEWESAPSARFCHPREEHLLHYMFVMVSPVPIRQQLK